ncbi:MAG: DUF4091 domain-containing protein [Sedimentisphaerales bacterium]|nr:DUF4091 domain-containing protein [Sedimentisphaerales bacterium]
MPVRLQLAANEYEGVQIVLRSHAALENIRVTIANLTDDQGNVISAEQIEPLVVGYVDTQRPSQYEVDYVGWWPDPLLDFLPSFDLEANVYQPIWLDVHTDSDQPAGIYRGVVEVTADGAPTLNIPLEVTVWDFAVPNEYHLPLALSFADQQLRSLYCDNDEDWRKFESYCRGEADADILDTPLCLRLADIRQQCHDLILEHHLSPDFLYRDYPPRIEDLRRWVDAGVTSFNILQVSSVGGIEAGEPYPADRRQRILDILEDYVPRLEEAGLLDYAYIYGFDEVESNQFAAMQDMFGEIKSRYPMIPLMTTARDYTCGLVSGLDTVVDIWVPYIEYYEENASSIAAARSRGRQVWWYICCVPYHPYPNWFVEYNAQEARLLMGFMPYKYHTDGFLYYYLNFWETYQPQRDQDGNVVMLMTPYSEPINRGPLTNHDGKSWRDYNGDGMLFYPGPDGPLASIRLKCIRDGLEDYEYLWLLQQCLNRSITAENTLEQMDWRRRAVEALQIDSTLVDSLNDYSTSPDVLLNTRNSIAQLIVEGYELAE